jgi:hypothetical protein
MTAVQRKAVGAACIGVGVLLLIYGFLHLSVNQLSYIFWFLIIAMFYCRSAGHTKLTYVVLSLAVLLMFYQIRVITHPISALGDKLVEWMGAGQSQAPIQQPVQAAAPQQQSAPVTLNWGDPPADKYAGVQMTEVRRFPIASSNHQYFQINLQSGTQVQEIDMYEMRVLQYEGQNFTALYFRIHAPSMRFCLNGGYGNDPLKQGSFITEDPQINHPFVEDWIVQPRITQASPDRCTPSSGDFQYVQLYKGGFAGEHFAITYPQWNLQTDVPFGAQP